MSNQSATTEKEPLASTAVMRSRRTSSAADPSDAAHSSSPTHEQPLVTNAIIPIDDPPTLARIRAAAPVAATAPATETASATARLEPSAGKSLLSTVRIVPVQQESMEFRDLRTAASLRFRARPIEEATAVGLEAQPARERHFPDQREAAVGSTAAPVAVTPEDPLLGETIVRPVPSPMVSRMSTPKQSSEIGSSASITQTVRIPKSVIQSLSGKSATADANARGATEAKPKVTQKAEVPAPAPLGAEVFWGAETIVKPVAAPAIAQTLAHVIASGRSAVAAGSPALAVGGSEDPSRVEAMAPPVAPPIATLPTLPDGTQDAGLAQPVATAQEPNTRLREDRRAASFLTNTGLRRAAAAVVVVAVVVAGAYVAIPELTPTRAASLATSHNSKAAVKQNASTKSTVQVRVPEVDTRTRAAANTSAPSATRDGKTLERQAVDAVARGAYAEAAALYEQMPQNADAPFHEAARIARRKARSEH